MRAELAVEGASAPATWWRDAVVYQIYVKSFADSDGDGIGDLDGITGKLPYVADLGIDAIWLSPCYPTPDRDGGYDVADYLRIADVYGGTAALERLLEGAHELGIRVLLDIVPNHCSVEHEWFQRALAEAPGGEHRSRFLFRDGRGPDGTEPPNNWQSIFGGPAWTRVRETDGTSGQWYLHVFDASQPDFDWRNPAVPSYFEQVLRYWFDRGVDGFRIDVAHGLLKEAGLPDFDPSGDGPSPMLNHADVHDVYRTWRSVSDSYLPERELMFVAEAWTPGAVETAAFIRGDELHATFGFDLLMQPWAAEGFRESVDATLAAVEEISERTGPGGVIAWTLNNHDVHRSASRYGLMARVRSKGADPAAVTRARGPVDVALGQARARAAVLFLLCLPGSIYLYQGEELGLPEVMDLPDDARRDPIFLRSAGVDVGRDGCRVPLPWTEVGPTLGFSPPGDESRPWLPQPQSFREYAASSQSVDPDSTLSLYRRALRSRRGLLAGAPETLDWVPTGRHDVLAYRRGMVSVVCVFGDDPYVVPDARGDLVLASSASDGRALPGSSAGWFVT
ncbi:MAG: glycoside hydrolase family 13 protein [Gaiellaceae bacterium]